MLAKGHYDATNKKKKKETEYSLLSHTKYTLYDSNGNYYRTTTISRY